MLRFMYSSAVSALAAALLVLSGCSSHPAVSGTVSLDGQPVDGGVIAFLHTNADPKQPTASVSAEIHAGRYSVSSACAPGSYTVEILWRKKTGRKIYTPDDPGNLVEETVQVVPAAYNTQSTHTVEIKAGANRFDFDIQSK